MEDNLCHYTKSSVNGSEYYLATCTDPLVKDPTCAHNCLKGSPDVVPVGSGDLWACCGTTNGDPDCTKTTSDTFAALPIDDLQTVGFPNSDITATSILFSTATGSALTNPSSSATVASFNPSSIPNPTSHLSNSVIAGLAVGATLVLILGIVIGAFMMRRPKPKQSNETPATMSEIPRSQKYEEMMDLQCGYKTELPTPPDRGVELPGHEVRGVELPGRSGYF